MDNNEILRGRLEQAEAHVSALIANIERNTCTHEETHRGGAIWEICDSCGAKWADDEGGRPEFVWPKEVESARQFLASQQGEQAEGFTHFPELLESVQQMDAMLKAEGAQGGRDE